MAGGLWTMAINVLFRLWRKDSGRALHRGTEHEVLKVQKPTEPQARQPLEISQRVAVDKVRDLKAAEVCVEEEASPKTVPLRDSISTPTPCTRPSLSLPQAFDTIVDLAEKPLTADQRATRQRIHNAYLRTHPCNIKHLVTSRLEDLDDLLFFGALRGHFELTWEVLEPSLWGLTKVPEDFGKRPRSRLEVVVSENLVEWSAVEPDMAWGTVVHEMLHAYACVMSGQVRELCACGFRVKHGVGFARASEAIVRVLGIEGVRVESIESFEGRCHSVADEARMREGGSALTEENKTLVVGYWGENDMG